MEIKPKEEGYNIIAALCVYNELPLAVKMATLLIIVLSAKMIFKVYAYKEMNDL